MSLHGLLSVTNEHVVMVGGAAHERADPGYPVADLETEAVR